MYVILIAIMIFVSATLAGLFAPPFKPAEEALNLQEKYMCCDKGNGEECRPISEKSFTFKGDRYELLKTDIYLNYGASNDITVEHMDPAGVNDPEGRPIFLNRTDKHGSEVYPECINRGGRDNRGYDRLYGKPDPRNTGPNSRGKGCYWIPNEFLVYVCRADSPGNCFAERNTGGLLAGQLKFDVYVSRNLLEERLGNVMPDVIKNCYKPPNTDESETKISFKISPGGQPNLQLRTFSFLQEEGPANWVSPYCKPAVYLYPERKTEINVSVFPQGEMLLTIPEYPKNGWNVIAEPNGDIYYGSDRYDYLYYEAAIPDQLITKPNEGYVMEYNNRALFLTDLVMKLGLNEKETKQFVEYWVPILPKTNYYFVGVIPERTLHEISPVLITPKPKNLIRVTLYFQPLEKKITVSPPLILPVDRSGYTAVEWGGIFKQDKNHPFSCFM